MYIAYGKHASGKNPAFDKLMNEPSPEVAYNTEIMYATKMKQIKDFPWDQHVFIVNDVQNWWDSLEDIWT